MKFRVVLKHLNEGPLYFFESHSISVKQAIPVHKQGMELLVKLIQKTVLAAKNNLQSGYGTTVLFLAVTRGEVSFPRTKSSNNSSALCQTKML